MRVPRFLAFLLALVGCGGSFKDTTTPSGIPNIANVAPRLWRSGQLPPQEGVWRDLASRIAPNGEQVLIVKLDDEVEGNDDLAVSLLGWTVLRVPLPPEDDKVWTVLVKPEPEDVNKIVQAIVDAYNAGKVVLWHCVHGRDRTSLISALVQMKLFGMKKDAAWKDMLAHGFRWELPDLDAYWVEDVSGTHKK
jgi:peptidoglycan/xylan/chitin deacetylase (PgdA/CDA1 family)